MAKKLSTDAVINSIRLKEQASAPDTPASGYFQVYVKTDGKLYYKNDAGTEVCITDKMTNPMTTAGDIIYGGASGAPTRLAAGTENYILKMGATNPAWAAAASSDVGTLTDWTPTITQSGDVTKTITYAKYILIGNLCWASATLAVTGSGTGNNAIVIAGFPKTPAANGNYGTAWINDNGTAYYAGQLIYVGSWQVRAHLEAASIGADPNFALANGDAIWLSCMFPWTE